jgi:hypothetical protein
VSTEPPTQRSSWPRARRNTLLALLALQTVLLFLLTSGLLSRVAVRQGATFGSFYYAQLLLVGLPSVATFVLPSAIGALCRTWQGAVALAVAPWWLVLLLHAGTLLHAAATADQPEWLISGAASLLFSIALFAALGLLGWLARHAVPTEW